MRVLSIQSSVAYGYVGNSAATFPLQRLGHEVWPVLTVHFSNHTGYGAWRGAVLDPSTVRDVIDGIADRGVLSTADAVLTGYQGSPGVADVVLETVSRVKALNPAAVYCCDPVVGDVGRGFFVAPGIPELMRDRIVSTADILTPNAFELAFLAGRDVSDANAAPFANETDLLEAARFVQTLGPQTILVTSVVYPDRPDQIGMVAIGPGGSFEVLTPLLPVTVNGAGDVTAALFLARLSDLSIQNALAATASSVFAILTATHEQGAREIRLIDAQAAIADPACEFAVRSLD